MKTIFFIAFSLVASLNARSQKFELPEVLKEISGLERLDDKTLLAINDGGNTNDIFILTTEGKLLRKVFVSNAKNVDWEDLASDKDYLYIADIGNNLNKRKNLCIYKVSLQDVRSKDTVQAEKIYVSYNEQTSFPPANSEKNYDAEALICMKDRLYILTKVNNEPWTGESVIYELPTTPGSYSLSKMKTLYVGGDGWYKDAITAAYTRENKIYFSTYDRIVECDSEFNNCKTAFTYEESTQKESLIALPDGFFVADERQIFLGGGYLYKIEIK